nr:putative AC transposase [Tanacetum cinerariifolium]
MANESASASTATGVGSTSAPTIREIISTNRNLQILKDFNLCIMTDNSQKAQCKHCFHFLSQGSNTTLRNHITHPHCEVIKAQKNQNSKARKTPLARDGSVFRYDPDYLREQFSGLVIQRALPFNHFDHEQTTRVLQNNMQPRYTHISRSTLKRDAMKLWLAAKQEIIYSFDNKNVFVNLTMDVWSAPHGVPAALNLCFNVNGVDFLIESISSDLKFFDDGFASKSKSYFKESLEGFWKEKKTMFSVLSRMAMDLIRVQASSVASEFAFSTSGRVLSILRTRLTPAFLEMCMCLKDHLDAKERKQDKCPLEIPLDFEDVFDDEVQRMKPFHYPMKKLH